MEPDVVHAHSDQPPEPLLCDELVDVALAQHAAEAGRARAREAVDGVAAGAEDTSNPYSVSVDTFTLTNAAHQITARARDSAGNTATSAAVNVTVFNIPRLVITAPAPGAVICEISRPPNFASAELRAERPHQDVGGLFEVGRQVPMHHLRDPAAAIQEARMKGKSLRASIDAFCRWCIHDPSGGGTCSCTSSRTSNATIFSCS